MGERTVLERLEDVVVGVVEPAAVVVDRDGSFPRAAIDALGAAGLLGLVSSTDVGGAGGSHSEAAAVVERLARACASTAMIVEMHYCATTVIEGHGPPSIREDIAAGRHLSTLAFSEAGSRSHYWAPLSSARIDGDDVVLDAEKSWVTAAGEADSYVWTSQAVAADGPATLWLVPASAAGLKIGAPFDGLGLRGNASSAIAASGVHIPRANMLGADGGGLDIALGQALPMFQVLCAACCVGLMETATERAVAHACNTVHQHLNQTLADSPVTRASLARMRMTTDTARAMLADTLTALASGRADAMLRVLEVKAVAAEAAVTVTDLAMRVGGGSAFRHGNDIDRAFRDARASCVMAPTTEALHEFVGRVVCGMELF
jgi:isovaleryl-CoA dehydrogenase